MPTTLIGISSSYVNTTTGPSSGDAVTAASIITPVQTILNNTSYLFSASPISWCGSYPSVYSNDFHNVVISPYNSLVLSGTCFVNTSNTVIDVYTSGSGRIGTPVSNSWNYIYAKNDGNVSASFYFSTEEPTGGKFRPTVPRDLFIQSCYINGYGDTYIVPFYRNSSGQVLYNFNNNLIPLMLEVPVSSSDVQAVSMSGVNSYYGIPPAPPYVQNAYIKGSIDSTTFSGSLMFIYCTSPGFDFVDSFNPQLTLGTFPSSGSHYFGEGSIWMPIYSGTLAFNLTTTTNTTASIFVMGYMENNG